MEVKINTIINSDILENYEKVLMKYYFDRIPYILNNGNPPPYEIEIQMSPNCNAKCKHCFGKDYPKLKNNLNKKENVKRIIDQILEFKTDGFEIDRVKFCGTTGEPLLNKLTLYAINELHKKRHIILFTNGIKLAEHKADDNYLKIISKIDRLNVSLDAGTTKILHKTKPGSRHVSLEDILEATNKIRKFSEKNIDITLSYVITNNNYFEILDFTRKSREVADRVRFRIDFIDRSVSHYHKDEIVKLLNRAREYKNEKFGVYSMHSEKEISAENQIYFSSKSQGLKCYISRLWGCIGSDGYLYPCGHIASSDIESYGNLLKKDLKEIWNNEIRKKYVEELPIEKCTFCSPFSLTTNRLLSALSQMSKKQVEELHKVYV